MSPPIKLGGDLYTTKPAGQGARKVLAIMHPIVMGFDGMAHILHLSLMKVQCSLQLLDLIKHLGKRFLVEVVQNSVKSGVQIHGHGYTP